jgi:hypothetical protein
VLGRPEQVHQGRDARQRRFDPGLGPAGVEFGLDLGEFGEIVCTVVDGQRRPVGLGVRRSFLGVE